MLASQRCFSVTLNNKCKNLRLYFHAAGSIKKGSDFNLTKLVAKFWNIYSYFYRIEVEITMARDVDVPSDKVYLQITKLSLGEGPPQFTIRDHCFKTLANFHDF